MNQRLAVGLCNPGLYSATGLGVETVWEALRVGKKEHCLKRIHVRIVVRAS